MTIMKQYLELFAKWLHKEGYYPIGNNFWQKENNVQTNISVTDLVEEYPIPVDLREVAGKAWDAAVNRATDLMMYGKSKATMPDKETYLNSLPSKP